jgi:hypothetical protein
LIVLTDPKPVHRRHCRYQSTTDDGTLTISDVSVFDTERHFAGTDTSLKELAVSPARPEMFH